MRCSDLALWLSTPYLATLSMIPCLMIGCLATAATAQEAASWTRFRGPNGTGLATDAGYPTDLSAKGALAWRSETPKGYSSPVIWGSRLFVTAAEDGELLTLAFDRNTGKELWRRAIPRPRKEKLHALNHPASPTPAVDAATVAVFLPDFGLLAFDHDGKELWRRPLGPFRNTYGMGASPILFGGLCYQACDHNMGSFLLAVDQRTGERVWQAERPRALSGHCTPIVFHPPAGAPAQIILPGSFLLDAYDARTGQREWWLRGLCPEMKSVPTLVEGVLYVSGYSSPLNDPGRQLQLPTFAKVLETNDADGSGDISQPEMPKNRAAAYFPYSDLNGDKALDEREWGFFRDGLLAQNGILAITPGGKGDVTDTAVRWSYRRSIPQLPSPVVLRGDVFLLADQGSLFTRLDQATGARIERGRLGDGSERHLVSPVAADGHVYTVSHGGSVVVAAIRPRVDKLEVVSRFELGEPCYATPALLDGKIYIRTDSALYCFQQP